MDNFDTDNNCVTMMTMHSAKGLEFDNVYIIGVEEGIFPGIRSIGEPEEMEEERRLCYVGITRARKRLTLVCARQRMLFGTTSANRPSRFIDEIPDEYIERDEAVRNDSFGISASRAQTGAYRSGSSALNSSYKNHTQSERGQISLSSQSASKPAAKFSVGDKVAHKAFGDGVILKLTPMGGDSLVEIEFAGGTKRLMMKAAAEHMQKK